MPQDTAPDPGKKTSRRRRHHDGGRARRGLAIIVVGAVFWLIMAWLFFHR